MASLSTTSGCLAAVRSETLAPPEPPTMTAGAMSSVLSSPANLSACISDSDAPVKQMSEAPVSVRGQRVGQVTNPRLVLAEATTRCQHPGRTLADDLVGDRRTVDLDRCHAPPPGRRVGTRCAVAHGPGLYSGTPTHLTSCRHGVALRDSGDDHRSEAKLRRSELAGATRGRGSSPGPLGRRKDPRET